MSFSPEDRRSIGVFLSPTASRSVGRSDGRSADQLRSQRSVERKQEIDTAAERERDCEMRGGRGWEREREKKKQARKGV